MKNQKLQELQQNPKVTNIRIKHFRNIKLNGQPAIACADSVRVLRLVGENVEILSNGGITLTELVTKNGVYQGVAHCSNEDNYSRQTGLTKSLGRAQALLSVDEAVEKINAANEALRLAP